MIWGYLIFYVITELIKFHTYFILLSDSVDVEASCTYYFIVITILFSPLSYMKYLLFMLFLFRSSCYFSLILFFFDDRFVSLLQFCSHLKKQHLTNTAEKVNIFMFMKKKIEEKNTCLIMLSLFSEMYIKIWTNTLNNIFAQYDV